MAADLADWTTAVNVVAGSVSITGVASVSITGTPNVNIANTPTVILGTGSATVGAISAINSTVTVAGTINIGNTPSVTISGTPTVNIGNTPSVTISGTPTVSISSGTVSISGTPNINILSQSVSVNVSQPQTALTDLSFVAGTATKTTDAVPAGTHSLSLLWAPNAGETLNYVRGHTTGRNYWPANAQTPAFAQSFVGGSVRFVVPINQALDSQYDVNYTATGNVTMKNLAVLDTQVVDVRGSFLEPVPIIVADAFNYGQPKGGPGASSRAWTTLPGDYDGVGNAQPAAGTIATVLLAAQPGKSWRCHHVSGSLDQTVAAANAHYLELFDGAALVDNWVIGNAAAASATDHFGLTDLAILGTVNTTMKVTFDAVNANSVQTVNIGAYLA